MGTVTFFGNKGTQYGKNFQFCPKSGDTLRRIATFLPLTLSSSSRGRPGSRKGVRPLFWAYNTRPTMTLRWVFLDIGGPILNEIEFERRWGQIFREASESVGTPCSEERYRSLVEKGVAAFASSVTEFAAWNLAGGDRGLHGKILESFWDRICSIPEEEYRRLNPIQDGAREAIEALAGRYRLGIVANQPARVEGLLRQYGVWDRFEVHGISEVLGLYKPDIRLFLHALSEAGATADESVMVGDRIDNDIVPARLLGMRAVHLRVGTHRDQKPRAAREVPDRSIETMKMLAETVDLLAGESIGPAVRD